jgi:ABC-type sugar transport system permease subunit
MAAASGMSIMLRSGKFARKISKDCLLPGSSKTGTKTAPLAYYIYTAGFEELKRGYASPVARSLFTIVFALTFDGVNNEMSKSPVADGPHPRSA